MPFRSIATASGFDGGTGYHDHNWGFWQGVSWQWGQVQGEGLSFVYGRVYPPADAADPSRIPAFLDGARSGRSARVRDRRDD